MALCSQCGYVFESAPCGPTHALVALEALLFCPDTLDHKHCECYFDGVYDECCYCERKRVD